MTDIATNRQAYARSALRSMSNSELIATLNRLGYRHLDLEARARTDLENLWREAKGFQAPVIIDDYKELPTARYSFDNRPSTFSR